MGRSIDGLASRLIQRAARYAPQTLCERLEEEWLAAMSERPGRMSRMSFALGCYWAATVITHDHAIGMLPAISSPPWERTMTAYAYSGPPLFSRRTTSAAPAAIVCDINITPLIDVMLVLLVTLIVSLPIVTHAVRLDMPQAPPSEGAIRPEVIDLDIEFDGTLVWNGKTIAGLQQLESYLQAEAPKTPQPEIHLRADRLVKYDIVAKVLALAQHNRMEKMGFVDTAEFKD
jgi:biopolymer transport protein ExbD